MDLNGNASKIINDLRTSSGLSIRGFAARAELSPRMVQKHQHPGATASLGTLRRVCSAFDAELVFVADGARTANPVRLIWSYLNAGGISQRQLALTARRDVDVVNRLLNDKTDDPRLGTLQDLFEALNCEVRLEAVPVGIQAPLRA